MPVLLGTAAVLLAAWFLGPLALKHVLPPTFCVQPAPAAHGAHNVMQALVWREHGASDKLLLETIPRPDILPHQVLVAVRTAKHGAWCMVHCKFENGSEMPFYVCHHCRLAVLPVSQLQLTAMALGDRAGPFCSHQSV